MKKISASDAYIQVVARKIESGTSRIPNAKFSDDLRRGQYFIEVDVTVLKDIVYIPISAASGRVSSGFVYQIEGDAKGKVSSAVKVQGDGVTKVTSGSILYAKIGVGKTATFRILIEVVGGRNREYKAVISRLNYKLNTNDARYRRFLIEIGTKTVRLK